MNLPSELFDIICGFLAKTDLKAIRQVCRRFSQAVIPLLFDQVYISPCPEDLDVSKLIGQRFGVYVKELVLITRRYKAYSPRLYDRHMKRTLRKRGFSDVTDQEVAASYAGYCAKRKEIEEVLNTGEDVVHLHYAFASMPNIQKICISDQPPGGYGASTWTRAPRNGIRRYTWRHPASVSIFAYCYSGSDREDDRQKQNAAWRPLLSVMSAIFISSHRIKYLSVCPSSFYFPFEAFDYLQHLASTFQHLESIQMHLSSYNGYAQHRDVFKHAKIAQTLCTAINLRSLVLRMEDLGEDHGYQTNGVSMFSAVLRDCEFPVLVTLSLHFFRFTEAEIVSFLSRHSTLARLTITDAHMDSGSWKSLLDCTRGKLNLESVTMTQLYDGFGEDWNEIGWIDHGEVKAFYVSNGGNPFATEALEARYPGGHHPEGHNNY